LTGPTRAVSSWSAVRSASIVAIAAALPVPTSDSSDPASGSVRGQEVADRGQAARAVVGDVGAGPRRGRRGDHRRDHVRAHAVAVARALPVVVLGVQRHLERRRPGRDPDLELDVVGAAAGPASHAAIAGQGDAL
jgi:hypothetical protein